MSIKYRGDDREIIVVLAGRSKSGKSALLHNLIGGQVDQEMTTTATIKEVKVHSITTKGVRFKIVDTPCLKGRFDASSEHLKMLDILIYCLPVSPGCKFHDTNPELMKSLQDCYGNDIWNHCIIVFTFSNMAWDHTHHHNADTSSAIALYTKSIENFLDKFQQELKNKLRVKYVNFKTVFDSNICPLTREETLVAIPAGNNPILPEFQLCSKGWRDTCLDTCLEKTLAMLGVAGWRDVKCMGNMSRYKVTTATKSCRFTFLTLCVVIISNYVYMYNTFLLCLFDKK